MFPSRAEVTNVPGQPAMYEYENFPQAVIIVLLFRHNYHVYLFSSPQVMLPVSIAAPLHVAGSE